MDPARGLTRGDVFWVDLMPRAGSEQSGRRPAVVVSHDSFNRVDSWRSVIVVPVSTSGKLARRGPTAVALDVADSGLSRPSVALCHQVTTIDRSKLVQRIGRLSSGSLAAIQVGLMLALDLDLNRP